MCEEFYFLACIHFETALLIVKFRRKSKSFYLKLLKYGIDNGSPKELELSNLGIKTELSFNSWIWVKNFENKIQVYHKFQKLFYNKSFLSLSCFISLTLNCRVDSHHCFLQVVKTPFLLMLYNYHCINNYL